MKFSQFLIMLVVSSVLVYPFAQMYEKAKYKQAAIIEVRSVLDNHFLAIRDHYIYTRFPELSSEDIKELELKLKMNVAFKDEPPPTPIDEIKEIRVFWEGVKVISFEDNNIKLTLYSDEILISIIGMKEAAAGIETATIVRDFKHEKRLKKEELREKEQRLKDQFLKEKEREKEAIPNNSSYNLKLPRRLDTIPLTV